MAAFRLSKWYLDCVSDSGDASILYTGAVRWGAFHLDYASLLESTAGTVKTRRSFRAAPDPVISASDIRWRFAPLHLEGVWQADSAELRCTVFSSPEGAIEWRCLMPRARAQIGARQGFGYAEHIAMTIAPWNLPLRTLRWGRFLSPDEWIVWIEWRSAAVHTWVYRNGLPIDADSMEDASIAFADGSRLLLDQSLVLRQGPLGATALASIPGLRHSVPGRILRVAELKWRSRARFLRPGAPAVEGWAIHERVEWPE